MGREDEVVNDKDNPYGADQIADLQTGVLAELKKVVDAEVAKRLEDCKALLPTPKTRGPRKAK